MKTCTKCKEEKEETLFAWKIKEVSKRSLCKACEKIHKDKYYAKNKEAIKVKSAIATKITKTKMRTFINDYKGDLGCLICKENNPACLDLHHTDASKKDRAVSDLLASGAHQKIYSEIEKCVVLCANCHRKHHAGQLELPKE